MNGRRQLAGQSVLMLVLGTVIGATLTRADYFWGGAVLAAAAALVLWSEFRHLPPDEDPRYPDGS